MKKTLDIYLILKGFLIFGLRLKSKSFAVFLFLLSVQMLPGQDALPCPTFGSPSGWRFSLLTEAGMLLPNRNLSMKGSELGSVFTLRNENESSLPGYHLGLHGKIEKAELPVYFKVGIIYNRLNERLSLSYTTVDRDTMRGIVSITTSDNGDTITYLYGNVITEAERENKTRRHHFFEMWEIPVMIGYTHRLPGWLMHMELGMSMNISNVQKGTILTGTDEFSNLSDHRQFENRLGFSYLMAVMIERPITDNSGIFASLQFRYIPNDLALIRNPVTQKYQLLGLNLGYRYSF